MPKGVSNSNPGTRKAVQRMLQRHTPQKISEIFNQTRKRVCVCVCVRMCMCVSVHTHTHTHICSQRAVMYTWGEAMHFKEE